MVMNNKRIVVIVKYENIYVLTIVPRMIDNNGNKWFYGDYSDRLRKINLKMGSCYSYNYSYIFSCTYTHIYIYPNHYIVCM